MTTTLRIQFIAIVLLTALAVYLVAPIPGKPRALSGVRIQPGIDLAGGAELRYTVLYEPGFPGDRKQATREATDVLRRRVDPQHLKEPKITPSGDYGIVVQLAGVDAEDLRDIKNRIATTGKLQFYASAPPNLQERAPALPDGYRLVDGILVDELPIIEGRHILHAEPELDERGRWVAAFQLDAEGAKRFDEAAERLYRQVPRGRIVIVLDGKLRSAPVVEAPAFHGRGRISGGKE